MLPRARARLRARYGTVQYNLAGFVRDQEKEEQWHEQEEEEEERTILMATQDSKATTISPRPY